MRLLKTVRADAVTLGDNIVFSDNKFRNVSMIAKRDGYVQFSWIEGFGATLREQSWKVHGSQAVQIEDLSPGPARN